MSVQLPPPTHRKRTLPQGELEAAATLKLGADQHTHTLSLSEARLVIHKVLENKRRGGHSYEQPEYVTYSPPPTLLGPRESELINCLKYRNLTKTLDYLDVFARFKDEENIKAVERLLNSHTELEMFERSQLGEWLTMDLGLLGLPGSGRCCGRPEMNRVCLLESSTDNVSRQFVL